MTLATEPPEVAPATAQRSPYVGLIPYAEADADFFFGRERDTRVIVANLRGSVLTLLYGASGVGKSSVLLAGVLPRLRDRERAQQADDGAAVSVAVVRHWRSDPPAELAEALRTSVEEASGLDQPRWDRSAPLIDAVREWTAHVRTALVILDQFEEYFLYHPDEYGPGTFADALAEIVNDPALRVHVLISLREDALSQLDRFKATIPGLFTNYLRLDHLDRPSARRAIEGPVEERNRRLPPGEEAVTVEPALVDAVLDQVRTGRLALGEGAAPSEAAGAQQDADRVETPFLQLVMQRLWTDAMERGQPQLTRAGLEELGGAERIVSHHLNEALAALGPERERLAAELFAFLVTPSKTKIAQAPSDLAYWTHRPVEEVTAVLRELAVGERRILRSVPPPVGDASGVERYEIFHDVLAEPISEWRAAHEQVRARETLAARLEEERRGRAVAERRRRRAIGAAVGAIALAAVAVVALIVALHAKSTARTQRATAQASAFASASFAILDSDPERSLLLAEQALRARPIPAADEALRQAIGESRLRAVLRGHTSRPCRACRIDGVPGVAPATVAIGPTGLVAAPIGSQAVVWDPVGGGTSTFGSTDLPAASTVSFSPDGKHILAGGLDTFNLGAADGGAPPAGPVHGHGTVVFSPDGRQVVLGERGGVAIADRETMDVVRRLHVRTPEGGAGIAFGGPRNATLAVTTTSGVAVWRWPARGTPAVVLPGPPATDTRFARAPVISPDGRMIAWVCGDDEACVRWIGSGRQLTVEHLVGEGVLAPLAFTPDSRQALIIGDKTATLMGLGRSPSRKVLSGHFDRILTAALSPDGAMVATASADSTIRLWEAATGKSLTVLRGHEGDVTGLAFSADGRMLASRGADDTLRLWRVIAGRVLRDATDVVYDARFSPDGRWVATGGKDGVARLYDMTTGRPRTLAAAPGGISAVAFNAQGRVLAAGATAQGGGFLAVKDTATGRGIVARTASTGPFLSATFLPDGRIVTGDAYGDVRLWSTSGGRLHRGRRLLGPGRGPADYPITLRAHGDLIAIGLGNGTVHIVRQDGTQVHLLRAASGGDEVVYAASFSPDGRRLVTAGLHQPIRVWSVADGRPRLTISGVPGTTFGAEFSPHGSRLVTGGVDGDVRLWDAATGRPLAVLHEHADVVNAVSFGPGGRTILSASDDRTARIYPCEPCEPVRALLSLARDRTSRDLTAADLRRYADGR
jgi:WD40 repeat protein